MPCPPRGAPLQPVTPRTVSWDFTHNGLGSDITSATEQNRTDVCRLMPLVSHYVTYDCSVWSRQEPDRVIGNWTVSLVCEIRNKCDASELGADVQFVYWDAAASHPSCTITCILLFLFIILLQGVETVKKEIDESILAQTGPYRPPPRLRKRSEFSGEKMSEEKIFEPNE